MKVCKQVGLMGGAAALTLSGVAFADDTSEELRARLAAAEAKIAQLENQGDAQWLTEARADEIRGLVQDVLADADTRASLLQSGMSSGYDNGFYLGSSDGNFSMKINGQLQTRFVYNNQDNAPASSEMDDDRWGFENTRTKLIFSGNAIDPSWTYKVEGNFARDGGAFGLEDAWIHWDYGNGWGVKVGQFKLPYLRETLVFSGHQLAVERSATSYGFGAGRSQGVMVNYNADTFRLHAAYSDGVATDDGTSAQLGYANTAWETYTTEYALGSRAEFLFSGNWDQFEDFTSPSGDEQGVMLGVAWLSQVDEYGTAASGEIESHQFTVDLSAEFGGANAFGAFIYRSIDDDAALDADQYAIVVQGGFYLTDDWEAYVRYEYADLDNISDDQSLLTVGVNRYFSGHNLKWSTDIVFGIDEVGVVSPELTGVRTDATGEDGQVAVRTQLQLMF